MTEFELYIKVVENTINTNRKVVDAKENGLTSAEEIIIHNQIFILEGIYGLSSCFRIYC